MVTVINDAPAMSIECNGCECLLGYNKSDIEYEEFTGHDIQRPADYNGNYITCPVCCTSIKVNA